MDEGGVWLIVLTRCLPGAHEQGNRCCWEQRWISDTFNTKTKLCTSVFGLKKVLAGVFTRALWCFPARLSWIFPETVFQEKRIYLLRITSSWVHRSKLTCLVLQRQECSRKTLICEKHMSLTLPGRCTEAGNILLLELEQMIDLVRVNWLCWSFFLLLIF